MLAKDKSNLCGDEVCPQVTAGIRVGRFLRTIRHLTARQIWFQVVNRLRSRLENPVRKNGQRPSLDQWCLSPEVELKGVWAPVPTQSFSDLSNLSFCFLNLPVRLESSQVWDAAGLPRLWRYNLHYFDWLWSCIDHGDDGWRLARSLCLDWIDSHRLTRGATGWEPYPVSLRIINWSLIFLTHWRARVQLDDEFRNRLNASLWLQSKWLSNRLEYHLMANHLLENAVALAVVGKCFSGSDARQLSKIGNEVASHQLREQILNDGMHFERSPMYHARMCWLVAVLAKFGSENVRMQAQRISPKMLSAMQALIHSDGQPALLNDSATGIYTMPPVRQNIRGAFALPDAGYYGMYSSEGDYIICDCAPIGPDYQPGHAHADTFTFEWSVAGTRFVTDTGTLEYESGAARDYDRSTAAHNTVTIDGQNSSEVWGGFRVGNRCKPKVESWEPRATGFRLIASHDGFARWVHRREFEFDGVQLTLTDSIIGWGEATVTACLHLGPGIEVETDGGMARCSWGLSQALITFSDNEFELEVTRTRYSPEFGKALQRNTLICRKRIKGNTSWTTHIQILSRELRSDQ